MINKQVLLIPSFIQERWHSHLFLHCLWDTMCLTWIPRVRHVKPYPYPYPYHFPYPDLGHRSTPPTHEKHFTTHTPFQHQKKFGDPKKVTKSVGGLAKL